jgi:tagaturonate reductase
VTQPILQFGTGRFLQAHVDLMVSEALERGQALGGITVVQSTSNPESSARLAAMARPGGFAVHLRGLDGRGGVVDRRVQVAAVRETLHAQADWQRLLEHFAQAEVVVSNTADAGYQLDPSDDAGLLADPHRVPRSYPARLLVLLQHRWRTNRDAPLTLLPTELVRHNGEILFALVAGLAMQWATPSAFQHYLRDGCVWANSLVDRIVSTPLHPVGAVAEPYALWAIARKAALKLPCVHPDVTLTDDLASYERLKLFILNLGHTWLAEQWLRGAAPVRTVLEAMHEPALREGLEAVWSEEVIPVFEALGIGPQARGYVDVVRSRLCNPFLDHALADIANHHEQKKARRVTPLLALAAEVGAASRIERLRRLRS